ncbi:hypothetical protein KTJ32_18070 [Acinetobacter gyllenbergii]|uniref:hypothetical protein n=1 Tax=Acinetobacter gyllenbergii TaxID=134534 RepID=UPI003709C0FF|nr:hypothetical protein [Acinetobacter gyllenbergii]
MKQISINSNPPVHMGKVVLASLLTGSIGIGCLTAAYALVTKPVESPIYSYGNTHSDYGVLVVKITSDSTGTAVVNLDGFRVYTSFDFDSFQDTNGQLGGDFTAIDIKNLAVDQVFDANGNNYGDFTNADDIRNMISIITAHIQKNKMVEGV